MALFYVLSINLKIKYLYCRFTSLFATKVINICDKSYKTKTLYPRQKL